MNADVFRWFVFVEGCMVLGTMLLLYELVARFIIPIRTTRMLIVASALLVIYGLTEIMSRLGEGPHWQSVFAFVAMTLYLGSLVTLYVWYKRPYGRKQRHEIIARFFAEQLLANQLRAHPNAELIEALKNGETDHIGRLVSPGFLHSLICRARDRLVQPRHRR